MLLAAPLLFVLVRFWYAPLTELSGDEAYYWTWSRNLAMGYLDHAPMVAWLIHLSTAILGTSELAVRAPGILLTALAILAVVPAMRLAGASIRATIALQFTFILFPITQLTGAVMTPDTPALCFFAISIPLAMLALKNPDKIAIWLILGVACGLAMLSKYTALLPISGMLLAILICRPNRPTLLGVLLTTLTATFVLTPLFYWNYTHNWASFRFQLGHGTGSDGNSTWLNLADYLGVQFLIAIPPLMILMLLCVYRSLRNFRTADPRQVMLALAGILPLAVFAVSSLRHKVQGNWPALGYTPLLILVALQLDNTTRQYRQLFFSGTFVAAIATLILHLPPALIARVAHHTPVANVGGWSEFIAQCHRFAAGRPIYCTRYQDASLFAFYLPGHPFVPVVHESTDRPSQFDLWPLPPLAPDQPILLITDGSTTAPLIYSGWQCLQLRPENTTWLTTDVDGLQTRGRFAVVAHLASGDVSPATR